MNQADSQGKFLLRSFVFHAVAIAAMLAAGVLPGFSCMSRPQDRTMPVEFIVDTSAVDVGEKADQKKDDQKPDKTPPPPKPDKDAVSVPDKKKPDKKDDDKADKRKVEVKVDKSKLVHRGPPRPATNKRELSKKQLAEIQRLLDLGAKPGDRTIIPGEMDMGLLLIKRTLTDAWVKPTAEFRSSRPATLELKLDRFGNILSARISERSGSDALDNSALEAARAVRQIRGLPDGFSRAYPDVYVEFELD